MCMFCTEVRGIMTDEKKILEKKKKRVGLNDPYGSFPAQTILWWLYSCVETLGHSEKSMKNLVLKILD